MPTKIVKLNKYKHKESSWILKSIIYRDKLYTKLKTALPDLPEYAVARQNLRVYNTILKLSIRLAKKCYFQSRFVKYSSDIKNTWKVANEILKRKQQAECPHKLYINNIDNEITNPLEIANQFKGAIVAKTTWVHWHTCSLLFNLTQHLCSMDIK